MKTTRISCLGAIAVAALASTGAFAANTITPVPGSVNGNYGSSTDLFDVSQGSTIINSSAVIFNADHAIGGVTPGVGEPYNVDFNGAGAGFITFKTASPVSISGFNLFVGSDGDTPASREFSTISLSGSTDGVTFTTLGSFNLPNTYSAYGSTVLELTSTFGATTDQYFRIDAVSKAQGQAQGGRILELDAIAAGAGSAVPEPAAWAMMIAGFGAAGCALRRQRPRVVAHYI